MCWIVWDVLTLIVCVHRQLLERGTNALTAGAKASVARAALTARCNHARRHKRVTEEAFKFLRVTAQVWQLGRQLGRQSDSQTVRQLGRQLDSQAGSRGV